MIKKYFSLAETSKILDQPAHKIRYLEKSKQIKFYKLHNRNYYKIDDIKNLSLFLNQQSLTLKEIQRNFLKIKIESLIKKFRKLIY